MVNTDSNAAAFNTFKKGPFQGRISFMGLCDNNTTLLFLYNKTTYI